MNVPDDWERDLTLYQERVYTSYDIVEALMKDEPKIVYDGVAIYVCDAVKPDELWAISGNWSDIFMVKQELRVSRHLWDGLLRHQRDVATQTGKRGVLRVLVAPESEWAMRVMAIETDPQYARIWPTMQRTAHRVAEHARACLLG